MIRFLSIAALALVALTPTLTPSSAAPTRTRVVKHRVHHRHYVRSYERDPYEAQRFYDRFNGPTDPYGYPAFGPGGRVPIGTYGEPVPFRTVQPTDVGIGVLAPNGYRGPGTASGGPAGGLNNGGGR